MVREVLDNQVFGEWTVIRYAGNRKQLCRCSCGKVAEVATTSLKSGRSVSCGNKSKHIKSGQKQFKDLTNQRFGDLMATRYIGETKWECLCDKGHITEVSSKHLSSISTCKICRAHRNEAKESPIQITKEKNTEKPNNLINKTIGDMVVLKLVGDDRYLCRCKCGYEKEIRGWNLRHPSTPISYTCRHKLKINDTFGKLTVISRSQGGDCLCRCSCGNIKNVFIGNLLNGTTTSCGCSKSATYTKEQVIEKIRKFRDLTGDYPFSSELASILSMGMTATYNYIEQYNLAELLNRKYGSKAEKDIANLISRKYKIELHNRQILNGLDLDIYIPELKVAIEFNGIYWHQYPRKSINYHRDKSLACIRAGIRLIHIFEYEWENEAYNKKILSMINGLMGNHKILYARNLKISEISLSEAKAFENDNHLQGYANSSIQIALKDSSDKIQGLITFAKPRFDSHYQYELVRLVFRNNTSIIGGSEKLFKYFKDKYRPSSIITYCNIAKFTGRVYTKLGFELDKSNPVSQPGYIWVDSRTFETLTRYQTTKKSLVERGLGSDEESEDTIMMSLGYCKIYDSGNFRFEYINKEVVT